MGLSYSREGAARRFVRSPPLAARSGGPKRPVLACFWAVFACCGGRGERSSGRGIRAAGKVLPFASFAIRRSPLARAAKNGQFWPVFGSFSRAAATVASGAKRQPSQHPGTPRVAQGWMGLSYSREGAARRFVRSPPLAARSGGRKRPVLACFWAVFACCGGRSLAARSGGQKRPVLACFLGRFRVPRRSWRAVRNVSHLSTLEPPGWHRGGWGFRIAGKVPPVASFALRRSPLARVAQNGQFWAVFACCGGRGERSSGRGIRVAGKVLLPFASFADRRSPLARAAKNGQFWPVFGPFSRAAATVSSGAKGSHLSTLEPPRVAQGWMGLSYSREGAARRFVRSPPLAARSGGPKRAVLACFWAVFACCGGRGERSSGRGIRVAGKVLPFPLFPLRSLGRHKTASFGLYLGCFCVLR
ncbi:hypothetical protein OPV22_034828 [Ensete ventricosum]|uniref:Uncharacterized protein n=1 Tax=Ensete ventricosum TaxID=4639 RepID=A0AAV8NYR8_ENSVE|nr:hypothetical protein OPV22_034828 [Ensete ventricosum]